MKTLLLIVDSKRIGTIDVQDVRGCSGNDPYHLAAGGFVIDLTADQARELADMVTHPIEEPTDRVNRALACHA